MFQLPNNIVYSKKNLLNHGFIDGMDNINELFCGNIR